MVDSAQDRQIVVATDHLRLVLAELGDGNAAETAVEPRLGLTLVTVADLAEATRRLATGPAAGPAAGAAPSTEPSVGTVLAGIRARAEERFTGWVPTMGKNRTVTGVQFKPYSSGGGFDRPTRADAGQALPPVPAPPGATRVRVGLFDTRLAPHDGLTGRFVADGDALLAPVAGGGRRLWWEGHATFIAGVIRRQAPTAVLDVRTALRPGVEPASGGPVADEEWTMPLWDFAARLVDYQADGVSVINLSVGVSTVDGKPPLVLDRAIARLTPTTVIVAAAGNHGSPHVTDAQRAAAGLPAPGAPLFPAALDNVLAVGALDGEVAADFNPRGEGGTGTAPWIDVFAPGVDTVSTYLGDGGGEKVLVRDIAGGEELVEFAGWASWSGTSFAAGEITGAVAALLAQGYSPLDAVAAVRQKHLGPEGT